MGKMQHEPCCWNVDGVSMNHPLLSFVIFQMLPEKMSLGGSGTRHSEGFLCKLPLWDRSLGEMNVVVTDQFSLESSTYFHTNMQCSLPLLTYFANTCSLGLLCRGTQNRICGSLAIILSSKVCTPSVNWTYFTKLPGFNLKRGEAKADLKFPHKIHVYPKLTNLFWRLQFFGHLPSLPLPTQLLLFLYTLVSGIRSIERLGEKAK